MEMQQIRYYVALAETLNFTRAAEQCNVSQPALTRAIQMLEYELGGPLIRREGRHSHLTELGQKMLPLLRQCYDSAISAKTLATNIKKGEDSCLSLGIAHTFDVALLIGPLSEVFGRFPDMQLKLRRGRADEIFEMLKSGEIELAICGPFREQWERLDAYPMFTEAFDLLVTTDRERAGEASSETLPPGGRFLFHRGADTREEDESRLVEAGIDPAKAHQVDSARDLEALVLAKIGVGLAPSSMIQSATLKHLPCAKLNLTRAVAIYAVAGRRRSPEVAAFLSLMRSADWSALERAA
jgi:DNA-binding transcriptional LysR family regulator